MTDAAPDREDAREGAAPRISLGTGRALVPVPSARRREAFAGLRASHGLVAAGVAAAMGLGFVGTTAVFASKRQPAPAAQLQAPADPAVEALNRVQGEVRALRASLDGLRSNAEDARQADTVRALKKAVDLMKGELDAAKATSAAAVGQLGAKIDRLDRDPGPKLNEIAARLDKLDREPDAKAAQATSQLASRLDRLERQVSAADATASIPSTAGLAVPAPMPPPRAPQPSPTAAAAVPLPAAPPARPALPPRPEAPKAEQARTEGAPRPEPVRQEAANRPVTLDGWLLRDVYDGVALVEGRSGGLREVTPGDSVPGAGEIRSIERRGRGWVVVTSRGIIQADNRW